MGHKVLGSAVTKVLIAVETKWQELHPDSIGQGWNVIDIMSNFPKFREPRNKVHVVIYENFSGAIFVVIIVPTQAMDRVNG